VTLTTWILMYNIIILFRNWIVFLAYQKSLLKVHETSMRLIRQDKPWEHLWVKFTFWRYLCQIHNLTKWRQKDFFDEQGQPH
jgi:hypothetical protein